VQARLRLRIDGVAAPTTLDVFIPDGCAYPAQVSQ
jgi:hypothetical protein